MWLHHISNHMTIRLVFLCHYNSLLVRLFHKVKFVFSCFSARIGFRSCCLGLIYKSDVVKNIPKFTGNTCAGVLCSIKLQAEEKNAYFVEHLKTVVSKNTCQCKVNL